MKLAWLILKILIAIYNGSVHQIGVQHNSDYYAWMKQHPDYVVVKSYETPNKGDYWLVRDSHDGQDYELLTFCDDISSNLEYTSIFHVCDFRKVE